VQTIVTVVHRHPSGSSSLLSTTLFSNNRPSTAAFNTDEGLREGRPQVLLMRPGRILHFANKFRPGCGR
jgi:hypothetical protein